MCSSGADIGGREHESTSEFPLNVQIPLVCLWIHQVPSDRIDGCLWIQGRCHGVQQPCGVRQTAASRAGQRPSHGIRRSSARVVENVGEQAIVEDSRSEEHTSELQSRRDLVCRLLLEKKKNTSIKFHAVSTRWLRV